MTLFCTPADDQLERCLAYPNITAHPVPGAVTAEVLLPGGDTGYFSEGVHTLTRTDNSKNCIYNVIVNKMSPVVRRLVFKTEYAVTCDSLNNLAGRSFFQSVLSQRKNQLQQVCSTGIYMLFTKFPFSFILISIITRKVDVAQRIV
ncbi:hypothetical protein EB796_001057 [Bugula neritina]|uniref:Uncharacterized protein n=1 Tax=Bugula neritina TaxID=10212 RepID=A0A7J7KR42_BUGNE|nr:hypothetical protein EB796_001057 [Bugula neritina]